MAVILIIVTQSCGMYSFSGASIPDAMKTVSIKYFENNAPLVVSSLGRDFTQGLEERIRNQSRLNVVRGDADASFEGRITGYDVSATAVQGNTQSTTNRLTITVNVKYKNNLKPELSFEQSFSQYKDFSIATSTLQQQEQTLIQAIIPLLTEDIFNRAFANW